MLPAVETTSSRDPQRDRKAVGSGCQGVRSNLIVVGYLIFQVDHHHIQPRLLRPLFNNTIVHQCNRKDGMSRDLLYVIEFASKRMAA